MLRRLKFFVFAFLLLTLAPILALAQSDSCPEIVKTALAAADQVCQSTGRNQACYGNIDMTAQPQAGITDFSFNKVGDIVDVASLQSLVLSPMDEVTGKWGVALLRLQANIPDSLPGQNVTFLLFGDVEIINGVTPDNSSNLRPMQAFYLRTGIGDSRCQEAPESGMLVQTPQGTGEVTFNVNGVDVQMGSTVFFQAQPKGNMIIRTLEGGAFITAQNKTQVIVPGTQSKVPLGSQPNVLDQPSGGGPAPAVPAPGVPLIPLPGEFITEILDLLPSGEPEDVTSYSEEVDNLQALPLDLLERPIEIAPPLSDEEVQQINDQVEQGIFCGEGSLPDCPTFFLPDGTECVLPSVPGEALPPDETRPLCDDTSIQSPGNDQSGDNPSVDSTDQPDQSSTSGDNQSGNTVSPTEQPSDDGDHSDDDGGKGGGDDTDS